MLSLLTITEGVRDLFVNSSCSHFWCFLHNPTKCSEPGEECHETQHCWLLDEAFMSCMSLQGMFLLRLQAHIDTNCRSPMSPHVLFNSSLQEMEIHHFQGFLIALRATLESSQVITFSCDRRWTSLGMSKNILKRKTRFCTFLYILTCSHTVYPSRITPLTFLPETCLEWKNSKPMPLKSKAGSLQVMDEMGIFSVVCHHGIVQFLMDMVQSGEL